VTLHTPEDKPSTPAPIEVTLDEAKQYLADAVQKKGPKYVYQNVKGTNGHDTCAYFDPETRAPSCIVGHVLASKGLTMDRLHGRERNLYTDVQGLIDGEILEVDNETQALLTIAQEKQDEGVPWGESVKDALSGYEDRAQEYEQGEDDPSEDYWY
jgi:hypothetical protein